MARFFVAEKESFPNDMRYAAVVEYHVMWLGLFRRLVSHETVREYIYIDRNGFAKLSRAENWLMSKKEAEEILAFAQKTMPPIDDPVMKNSYASSFP